MQRSVFRAAMHAAVGLLTATSALFAPLTHAQTSSQPAPQAQQLTQAAPGVDPSFSAYSLAERCLQKGDNVAQGQCVGAIRGIIHGYQYAVLFLGQRAALPANETQRVSLCLRDAPVASIISEFIADTRGIDAETLKRTPAEVAVLGSVHLHHPCN
ncbi:hypothetical protein [Paraburkholderia hayleyella]|uniref:hypothetical protein n=1 Tax=Paraburkholderia hayleyella TaxID=2152889 RepID=UPI001291F307|nr:hypothetical protein [Paraburkholderia hayleyella]